MIWIFTSSPFFPKKNNKKIKEELLLPEELEEGDAWVPNDSRMSRKPGAKAKFRPGNVMLTLTSEEGYLYKLGHINRTWVQRWFGFVVFVGIGIVGVVVVGCVVFFGK